MGWRDRVEQIVPLVVGRSALTRPDRRRWASANELAELGELTALWLQGRIDSQPHYYGRVDVDEPDAPGMTAALVAANRAGYVTFNSQAGQAGQHAAVAGFASPATHLLLQRAVSGSGLRCYSWPCKPRRSRRRQPPAGARWWWQQLGEADIANMFHGCNHRAIDALCNAVQVHVYDPVPGRNTLWPVLRTTFSQSR